MENTWIINGEYMDYKWRILLQWTMDDYGLINYEQYMDSKWFVNEQSIDCKWIENENMWTWKIHGKIHGKSMNFSNFRPPFPL